MTVKALLESFAAWSGQNEPLVLASVYETEGSTYSKAGARMLITGDGRFQGMLSGGCLEGDLALRAKAVLDSGKPQTVTYDLAANDEALWGLGVGCDGAMRIFLQALRSEEGYQPFAAMTAVLASDAEGTVVTVLESEHPAIVPGATRVAAGNDTENFGIPREYRGWLAREAEKSLAGSGSHSRAVHLDGHALKILFALLLPPPRLLVLGAGLDAQPVVSLAGELGWRVTVQDHRPAYIESGRFEAAERILCEPADALADKLQWSRFEAVIVMSHHLDTDRTYLAQVAKTDIPYVGLLGPPNRRARLLEELGSAAGSLEQRLHGPAGLDIGADGPASIALSILAEMHAELKGKSPVRRAPTSQDSPSASKQDL